MKQVGQWAQAFLGDYVFGFRFRVSIGGRVRVSFFLGGSFRVRVRAGLRVRFWLEPGTRLDSNSLPKATGIP